MKKHMVKRLVYIGANDKLIGNTEYDGHLTNDNILGSVHEIGKTAWMYGHLWLLKDDVPTYRIEVQEFYHLTKRWYERLLDAVKRI